jgi:predicted DsbA family dithiol-disulfide isomerase
MKIELWSDFACPFCYIGKVRFDRALQKFAHKDQVEVIYKAYQLDPGAPKVMTQSAAETFAKGHHMSVDKAKERFQMFIQNAKMTGLDYNYDIIQMTNSFDAHRIAKWARKFDKEPELTNRFMAAYFTEGKNIADVDTLVEMVEEFGLDGKEARKVLESNDFADVVQEEITEARQVGVRGVPFFVLNRKYGVSGAQQEEYFAEVLETLWKEEHPLETIDGGDEGAVCTDDSCSI